MGKAKRNKKKKNYTVTGEKVEKLSWDDLAATSNEIRGTLITLNQKLANVGNMYKDIIEKDETASRLYNGIAAALNEIVEKYNQAVDLHSIKNPDGTQVLYTGYVNENDDNQVQLFMNLTLLYSGIANELQTFANTSVAAFMARVEEVLTKEKENDNGETSESKSDTTK